MKVSESPGPEVQVGNTSGLGVSNLPKDHRMTLKYWVGVQWGQPNFMGFSGCTVPPDSKETELGSSDQESSPSAGKNTVVVFSAMSCMEVCPYSYFCWCGYFQGPWMLFVTTDELSLRVTKTSSRNSDS